MPTALIVEDEPGANELLAMLVQLRGYRTESAFTGTEALDLAARGRPDLVFLDLMLPDLSGFEVCRALRAARATCSVPVVMVTARVASENRAEGFRAGATDYVPKPYTPDQIFAAMERADAWSRDLLGADAAGTIALDARADQPPFADLSRLGALILARTSAAEGSGPGPGEALVALAQRAIDWGRSRGLGLVATLSYRCDGGRAVVGLRDEAGWFGDDSPLDPAALGGLIDRGWFREVAFDPGSGEVALVGPQGPAGG